MEERSTESEKNSSRVSQNIHQDFMDYFGGDVLRRFNREAASEYGDGYRLDYQAFAREASERMTQAQSPEEALEWLMALASNEWYGDWDSWEAVRTIADEIGKQEPDPALKTEADALWEKHLTEKRRASRRRAGDVPDAFKKQWKKNKGKDKDDDAKGSKDDDSDDDSDDDKESGNPFAKKDSKKMASTTCKKCGEPIEKEGNLWVCTASGDEGGTYDHCEEGGRHVPVSTVSRKRRQAAAVIDVIDDDSGTTIKTDQGDYRVVYDPIKPYEPTDEDLAEGYDGSWYADFPGQRMPRGYKLIAPDGTETQFTASGDDVVSPFQDAVEQAIRMVESDTISQAWPEQAPPYGSQPQARRRVRSESNLSLPQVQIQQWQNRLRAAVDNGDAEAEAIAKRRLEILQKEVRDRAEA